MEGNPLPFKPTAAARRFMRQRKSYKPGEVLASLAAWEHIEPARDTRNAKARSKALRDAYARWEPVFEDNGTAEVRSMVMQLGPYIEAIWDAYNAGQDWHDSLASWDWEAIPLICEKALDFENRADHYFPNLMEIPEVVALLKATFPKGGAG